MMKKPSPAQIEKLAYEIKDFLIRHVMWCDVRIYYNGKALSTDDGKGHYAYNDPDTNYVLENIDPKDFFKYVGENILCMSFEGPFYELVNCYVPIGYYNRVEGEFRRILQKYGLGYELGHAWNLSTFLY
jgi:hypothetical protein